jgi:hypothetical protein
VRRAAPLHGDSLLFRIESRSANVADGVASGHAQSLFAAMIQIFAIVSSPAHCKSADEGFGGIDMLRARNHAWSLGYMHASVMYVRAQPEADSAADKKMPRVSGAFGGPLNEAFF